MRLEEGQSTEEERISVWCVFTRRGRTPSMKRGKLNSIYLKIMLNWTKPILLQIVYVVCLKRDQLEKHVKGYQRHIEIAKKRGVTNHNECLVKRSHPYKMSQLDYRQSSTEESISYFTKQSLYKLDKDTKTHQCCNKQNDNRRNGGRPG